MATAEERDLSRGGCREAQAHRIEHTQPGALCAPRCGPPFGGLRVVNPDAHRAQGLGRGKGTGLDRTSRTCGLVSRLVEQIERCPSAGLSGRDPIPV